MSSCTPEQLHAHADAIEHAANLGGYMVQAERGGPVTRRVLSTEERAQWLRDAAVIREAAHQIAGRSGDG